MSAMISFSLASSTGGGVPVDIVFDATLKEQHNSQAQVTDHQVETGPDISDHIRPMPKKLQLDVLITNTPITPGVLRPDNGKAPQNVSALNGDKVGTVDTTILSSAGQVQRPFTYKALVFPFQFDRVQELYDLLVAACSEGAICTVYTSVATYPNMAIESVAAPRDAMTGSSIQLTIDLKEIRVAETVLVATPAPRIQKKKRGNKPLTTPPATEEKKARASFAEAFGEELGFLAPKKAS